MNWEIFIGITVLVGFVISIGKIIANNTQSMTEMKCSIDNLGKLLEGYHSDLDQLAKEVKSIDQRLIQLEHFEPTVYEK